MDLIDQFIERYRREFDFFEQASRIVAQQLESRLESSGIRAMVTSRAKNPKRLESKVRQRAPKENYQNVDDIYSDIVDLAGVRVALYFPGERSEVDKIVSEHFKLTESAKIFTGTPTPSHEKRFSGYWATHYRLKIRETTLSETNQRFADARVEVQVASVLMHAWSEVEHDLVYKPMQGSLSPDELALLDQLNGMVLTGEIALERLQKAAEARVSRDGSRFDNHYDLASFLFEYDRSTLTSSNTEPVVGDVELLFRLLKSLEISDVNQLRPYLEQVTEDTERRPLAEQIIDQIVAAEPNRYAAYAFVRSDTAPVEFQTTAPLNSLSPILTISKEKTHDTLGYFMAVWISFERFLRDLSSKSGQIGLPKTVPSPMGMKSLEIFKEAEIKTLSQIRQLRNHLVHGIEVPDGVFLRDAGKTISKILNRLAKDERHEVSEAAKSALASINAASD